MRHIKELVGTGDLEISKATRITRYISECITLIDIMIDRPRMFESNNSIYDMK